MIGSKYWATGITMVPYKNDQWGLILEFFDDGFCDNESSEGMLRCRYAIETQDLEDRIKMLMHDARHLGIQLGNGQKFALYIRGDGEHDLPYPPNPIDFTNALAAKCGLRGYQITEPAK